MYEQATLALHHAQILRHKGIPIGEVYQLSSPFLHSHCIIIVEATHKGEQRLLPGYVSGDTHCFRGTGRGQEELSPGRQPIFRPV